MFLKGPSLVGGEGFSFAPGVESIQRGYALQNFKSLFPCFLTFWFERVPIFWGEELKKSRMCLSTFPSLPRNVSQVSWPHSETPWHKKLHRAPVSQSWLRELWVDPWLISLSLTYCTQISTSDIWKAIIQYVLWCIRHKVIQPTRIIEL